MLFNSIEFAVFLPIVFLLYWFVFNVNIRIQNLFIVVVSYIFYGWWDSRFLLLMGATTLFSWLSGIFIEKFHINNNKKVAGIVSLSNIILNLGILGCFKYYNFFVESFVDAFVLFGRPLEINTLKIILPVGISFYTFQALSYSIDVYRRKIEPAKDVVSFFAYVSFFPQLVAGPIERATNLLPQFYKARKFDYTESVDGLRQILWGLFKKIIIADNCAVIVNSVFDNYQNESASTLLLAAIFFSFQIYGDFSGYSDIAIGTARLFGFQLMRNFNYPYFSRDIAEFWRRWHISLTTWFRDYIYFPLGGSRGTMYKTIRNTFVIFLVSGFWHGANWTFVVWGLFHAILFIPLLIGKKNRQHTNIVAEETVLPGVKELAQILFTFILVSIGWIFFRSGSVSAAFEYISLLFDRSLFTIPTLNVTTLSVFIFMLIAIEWIQRRSLHGLFQIESFLKYRLGRWIVYILLITLIIQFGGKSDTFIYFQF
ncbi:MAG: MBOAT family protein [Paludibacteraceae bacterium]|nr:MBOAT family protein [Paludibacteraceae bacterium]